MLNFKLCVVFHNHFCLVWQFLRFYYIPGGCCIAESLAYYSKQKEIWLALKLAVYFTTHTHKQTKKLRLKPPEARIQLAFFPYAANRSVYCGAVFDLIGKIQPEFSEKRSFIRVLCLKRRIFSNVKTILADRKKLNQTWNKAKVFFFVCCCLHSVDANSW